MLPLVVRVVHPGSGRDALHGQGQGVLTSSPHRAQLSLLLDFLQDLLVQTPLLLWQGAQPSL